jgi:hypothetical protein
VNSDSLPSGELVVVVKILVLVENSDLTSISFHNIRIVIRYSLHKVLHFDLMDSDPGVAF